MFTVRMIDSLDEILRKNFYFNKISLFYFYFSLIYGFMNNEQCAILEVLEFH
jgi:hypothetical protein